MKKIILLIGFSFFLEICSFAFESHSANNDFVSSKLKNNELAQKDKHGWDSRVKNKRKKKLKRRRGRTVYGGTSKYSKRYNPFDINN